MRTISLLALAGLATPAAANTRVGNGGDTLGLLLEGTRTHVVDVLTVLAAEDRAAAMRLAADACGRAAALSEGQAVTCADFIVSTLDAVLLLNSSDRPAGKVPFAWSFPVEGPLTVVEDGVVRPVDAVTDPSDAGPITFSWESVRAIADRANGPSQLIALLYHELGHKVPFRGRFTGDVEQIDGLSGRALHDVAGGAVAVLAERLGLLAKTFQIVDTFHCEIALGDQPANPTPTIERHRWLDLDHGVVSYRAGFGFDALGLDQPGSGISWLGTPRRAIVLKIVERDGCLDSVEARARRSTTLQFVPVPDPGETVPSVPPVVLRGRNPLCEDPPRPVELTLPEGGRVTCFVDDSVAR